MELIKGRWYKNLGDQKDHIGRFSGWYDLEVISVSEYIYEGRLRGAAECFTKDYESAEEIPLSEIQQYLPDGHPDKEFVLPEKWCVKCITQEEANAVEAHLFGSPVDNIYLPKYVTNKGVSGPGHNPSYYKEWNCKEITFEQFKKYVLKTKEMEEKEIIGYKLKEDCKQYEEASKKIAGYTNGGFIEFKYFLKQVDSGFISSLKKAGVLDLWFEPVFKERFRIGDWVTWSNGVTGRIVNHCKSFADSWSLDVKGDLEQYNSCSESGLRLATPEEIKKTLVEEAIKRGFKGGVKIDKTPLNYSGTAVWTLGSSSSGFIYEPSRDELQWSASQDIVYRNGKWAEILPNYPQIEINGYKGEFFDWGVKFGCAEIHKNAFIYLNTLNKDLVNGDGVRGVMSNRQIESITIGKGVFSKDQIKLIADHYLNKK